ncbi:hypothetical protein [Oceanobacillus timonensis]|uniref:hypothetical protein n=1 Tax=Oceanobacillus timonensis TaxID=1926285 RepID=UPI0009BC4A9D|nr:hypothetical protein [Oceanobacillus timonensis]
MERFKKLGAYAIGIFILIICITVIADESKLLYPLLQGKNGEEKEVTTVGKTVSSDLFGSLKYYAVLEDDALLQLTRHSSDQEISLLTKQEFEQLDAGETITKNDSGITDEDQKSQITEHLIVIIVFSIYPSGFLVYNISHIPFFKKWREKGATFFIFIVSGILCLVFIMTYVFMGKSIISVVQSYSGDQIEVEAFISDTAHERNTGRFSRDSYYLHLSFYTEDGDEEIFISKEVSSRIYSQNHFSIPVRYPEGQPYKAHIAGTKFGDFIGSSFIIYSCTLIITVFLIYAAFLMRRKKKTGSFYKKKDFSNK